MGTATYSGTAEGGQQPVTPTEIRLRLLENGYTPIPNVGKTTYLKAWPTIDVNPDTIAGWARKHSRWQDTGIRVQDGLTVIDFDVNDREMMDEIARAVEEAKPGLARALIRYGKGFKEAWFIRCDEPFGRIHTRRWLKPGDDLDKDGSHVVECFGGASPRQFGAFGAHTRDADGSVKIAYEWAVEYGSEQHADGFSEWQGNGSPLEKPLAELPAFTKQDIYDIVDIAERLLEAAGWTYVVKTQKGESEATRVFDLVPEMVFETNQGEAGVPFAALRERATGGEEGLRVSASFIEPGRGHSLTRCLVGRSHSGDIFIWDSATDVTHFAADRAPVAEEERQIDVKAVAERLQRLAEHASEAKQRRLNRISSEDSMGTKVAKYGREHVLCPYQQLQVVSMYADSINDGQTLVNARFAMQRYSEIEIGPRGGEKRINPVDVWLGSDGLVEVRGLRMRPDMPRPLYDEDGFKWKNVYTPVVHPSEGGDASVGRMFLEQLLPDAEERLWFTRWLAYKYRHPEVPGPAVVMVARQHGTGRGTMATIIEKLFGQRYVKALDFSTFAGKTYQSQYNSWGAETLVVTVDESSEAQGGSIYASKRDTYERIKELVEPRAKLRHFVRHGLPPFTAYSYVTYFIATNHADALPLPADDRRIWVGTNGERRELEFWDEVNEWMEVPENIGAFAAWLEELDLGEYSPYLPPPMTSGKRAMIEMSASPIDHAMTEALQTLPGEVLIPEQIISAMRKVKEEWSLEFPERWEAIARKQVQSRLYRIGVKDGPSWVLRVESKKYPLYARDAAAARRWTVGGGDDLRAEALRNGAPTSDKSVADALAKLKVVGGTVRGDG